MASAFTTSPQRRRWRLPPSAPPDLALRLAMSPLWAQLLYNRSILEPAQAREFLAPDLTGLHDPFLLPQMDRAVERIRWAMDAGETIAVYGDFDADGVTATALLQGALTALGGRTLAYIPHRVREGHGLNLPALRTLREQGVDLLITVDCGVSAVQEVEVAQDAGMDVIITDHHAPPATLPRAWAIVTPSSPEAPYPNPHLTGAGLAFKLAHALYQRAGRDLDAPMLELAALGTVADMAPILGENRVLAKAGLEALRSTRRPGLLALLERAGVAPKDLDHESIPFVLAPRLNAPGRIDTADLSYRLLTCDAAQEAHKLAQALEDQNGLRKQLTEQMMALAQEEASHQAGDQRLLLLAGHEFAPGVNGLVATRLVETFSRPVVVVSLDGELARGSGRSIPEFNLAEAQVQCADLLLQFGGHPAAAGFVAAVDALPALQERLQAIANQQLRDIPLTPRLRIDAQVRIKDLLGDTFGFLRTLAPFGQGNPPPVFLTRGVQVVQVREVGAQGQHLNLKLKHEGAAWDAVAFRQTWPGDLPRDVLLDLVYTLGENSYRGKSAVQLQVLDFRPSQEADDKEDRSS